MTSPAAAPARTTSRASEGPSPRPIGVAALIAALWAVVIGLVVVVIPVLIGWAMAPGPASDPVEALRTAAHVWIAAHQVPVQIGTVTLTLLPLGMLLLPATLLFVVGSWAARVTAPRTLGDALLLSSSTALAYAFMAALVNAWVATDEVSSVPGRAFVGTFVVAWVFVTWSVLRTCGFLAVMIAAIAPRWRAVVAGACAGLAAVFAGSALLAAIVMARQLDEASGSFTVLKSGVIGTILLTIIALAYVPNVVLWTASFAVGPGFGVGTGTQVTTAASDTGALPVFPLVAALPSDGAPPVAAALVMLLPLVAGALVGIVVARRLRTTDPEHVAGWAAASGAISGIVLGVLAQISSGGVGDGRLASAGPSGWRVALMAAVSLAVVAAATGWFAARRRTGRVIHLPREATASVVVNEPAPAATTLAEAEPADHDTVVVVDLQETAPIAIDRGL